MIPKFGQGKALGMDVDKDVDIQTFDATAEDVLKSLAQVWIFIKEKVAPSMNAA